jgi:hypothetical protein
LDDRRERRGGRSEAAAAATTVVSDDEDEDAVSGSVPRAPEVAARSYVGARAWIKDALRAELPRRALPVGRPLAPPPALPRHFCSGKIMPLSKML